MNNTATPAPSQPEDQLNIVYANLQKRFTKLETDLDVWRDRALQLDDEAQEYFETLTHLRWNQFLPVSLALLIAFLSGLALGLLIHHLH